MRRRSTGGVCLIALVAVTGPAFGQPVRSVPLTAPDSNIAPTDTRSILASPLPMPPVPSFDQPRAFLQAARDALARGHTGEAQEALERAESRLLDRSVEAVRARSPDTARAVLDIGVARQALAARDRIGAGHAINDAILAATLSAPVSGVAPPVVAPAPLPSDQRLMPTTTYALLPGHWQLDGARWVWISPDSVPRPVQARSLVEAEYVWRDGRWTWVPAHYAE